MNHVVALVSGAYSCHRQLKLLQSHGRWQKVCILAAEGAPICSSTHSSLSYSKMLCIRLLDISLIYGINLPPVFQTAVNCRIAMVMMQYSIMANSYWLLVEGIYLHNLLVITVFTERNYFKIYLCIGWGELGVRRVKGYASHELCMGGN